MPGNKASKITNLTTKTLHKLPPQAFPPPLSWFHTQQGINDKVYPHLKQPPLKTCSSDVPIWSCVWSSKTVPVCVDSKYFLSHSFQLCSNYPCRYHTTMYNHSLNHISLEKDRPRFLQSHPLRRTSIPGLISCTGVTKRWGLLSHAHNGLVLF